MSYLGFWEFFLKSFVPFQVKGALLINTLKNRFQGKNIKERVFGAFVEAFVSVVWRYLCIYCGGICVHYVEVFVSTLWRHLWPLG